MRVATLLSPLSSMGRALACCKLLTHTGRALDPRWQQEAATSFQYWKKSSSKAFQRDLQLTEASNLLVEGTMGS